MDKNTEIADKIQRIVRMLAAEDLGGVLVGSQPNFAWLSAGGSNGIDLSREPGAGSLLVTREGKLYLLANNIEMPRLLDEAVYGIDLEPVGFTWEEEKANGSIVADRARALIASGAPLGTDLPGSPDLRVVENELARCRYSLTSAELVRIRQLGKDAGTAMGALARSLEPGESERQVAAKSTAALAQYGIHPVVNLVAGEERLGKYRHPIPTDKKWERSLMLVACARRGGLIVSLTRIICVGAVPDEMKIRTAAAARVNANLMARTRPGATGAELYQVAVRAYESEGYPGEHHRHHQGGATGYRTREWVAHPACREVVRPGQAFAWNPSITGTKIEETIIAHAEAIETITTSVDWPMISATVDGTEYFSPDILQR
ncbi:MAG: aminopeptidase P family protein [Pyrinomonadaceae bacterium]